MQVQSHGKIVNNFMCYIVVFLDSEEAHNATMGQTVKIRLSDTTEIDADITQIIEQEDRRCYDNI